MEEDVKYREGRARLYKKEQGWTEENKEADSLASGSEKVEERQAEGSNKNKGT